MTADELYEKIVEQITPEQALKRFISTAVEQYESLKSDKMASHGGSPLFIIAAAAIDMGWTMALEGDRPDKDVDGIVVGTAAYMDKLFPPEVYQKNYINAKESTGDRSSGNDGKQADKASS